MSKKRRKAGEVSPEQPQNPAVEPAADAPVHLRIHREDDEELAVDAAEAPADVTNEPAEPSDGPLPADEKEDTSVAADEPRAEDELAAGAEDRPAAESVESDPVEGIDPTAAPAEEVTPTTAEDSDDAPTTSDTDLPQPEGEGDAALQGEINVGQVIEAILFSTETPLTPQKIVSVLGVASVRDVKQQIATLNERYERENAAYRIEKIAGGYQMLTLPQFNTWIRRLRQARQESRFSAAALETLAVVAYKQPVVRAEIEAIRGVSAGEMLNRLRELGLVKIVGRAEDVGRPMLYGTTKRFLELFGLASLEDLPSVEQLQPPK